MATTASKERLVIKQAAQQEVVNQLQGCLVNLLDLALQCKQAHWNVIGRRFHSFHVQLDEIVDDAREGADEVAERIATLTSWADGRVQTVSSQTTLDPFPEGRQNVNAAVTLVANRLALTIERLREAIEPMGELDRITEDLLIGISAKLEKHLWMVQTQEEED